ncbi:hypothetical protein [Actinoplanes regularis]|uniref:hypothetical protein n=1 Tax=Actinoplanes regularis TaxID=52697 RepID=UPI001177BFD9|nr:hypothetical protein [Actinoplanes regularis]GIE84417.1 hypothetical protein Are01nite_08970 [Actinoplanes regularis]
MKPSHEHAVLFRAPSAAPAADIAEKSGLTVDAGLAAMRKLRFPFMTQTVPPTGTAELGRAA